MDRPILRLISFNNIRISKTQCIYFQAVVDRWWKEDRLLFNSYGPTETTVSAAAILLHPSEPISIGIPLPNYVCCLLDETTGHPTSAKTGELCISGPGVALGYVRRDSLTKEKFTEHGYRTGDRVTIDNGRIFFHERIDSQVKIRGFRIELDEIEQELLRINSDIQSAAVIVLNEQLIAFIVGQLTELNMREVLGKRLPRYMVPDRLIKLNEIMPRLISGKIDRKALIAHVTKDDAEKRKADETIIDMSKFTFILFSNIILSSIDFYLLFRCTRADWNKF
jgi:acyl-coenzyme A synthetase/AMP-(fatty) acid ligase